VSILADVCSDPLELSEPTIGSATKRSPASTRAYEVADDRIATSRALVVSIDQKDV
jgi:hypothetical protein